MYGEKSAHKQKSLNPDSNMTKMVTEDTTTESSSAECSSTELSTSNVSDANNDGKKDGSSSRSICSSGSSDSNKGNSGQETVSVKQQTSWGKIDHRTSFEVWLKSKKMAEQKRRQLLLEKEAVEKQKMEQRKAEAQKCYEAWKKNADNMARQKLKQEREKESQRKAKEAVLKRERLESNKKAFEEWKRKHVEKSGFDAETICKLERSKSTSAVNDRIQEASKAYQQWYEEKNADIARKARLEAVEKQVKEMQISNEKEYRKALANDAFNLWLDIKNKQHSYESSLPGRIMRYEREMKYIQRPWRAPSRPCPSSKLTANGAQKRCCRKQVKTVDRVRRLKSGF